MRIIKRVKKKPPVDHNNCPSGKPHGPWKFKDTINGKNRTCKTCGYSITEAPHNLFGKPEMQNVAGIWREKK